MPLTRPHIPKEWSSYLFTEYITHAREEFCPQYAVRADLYNLIFNVLDVKRPNPLNPANYCNASWEAHKEQYLQTRIREVYDRVENPPRVELYDLQNDPYEWNNLAAKPDLATARKRLLLAIDDWRRSTVDPLLNLTEFNKQRLKGAGRGGS